MKNLKFYGLVLREMIVGFIFNPKTVKKETYPLARMCTKCFYETRKNKKSFTNYILKERDK